VGRSVTRRDAGRRAAWEAGDRGTAAVAAGIAGGGPVKAMFATYALLIVVGLAYFVALGVANR
jgi:hypothetical protein